MSKLEMPALWHGSFHVPPLLLPASKTHWWNIMDHDAFLNPLFDEEDPDQRAELDSELRLAYGNIVYEALLHCQDQKCVALARDHGLHGLGDHVAILFGTDDPVYAERYGDANRIDTTHLIAHMPDDNVSLASSWILVFLPNQPFPLMKS